MWRTKQATSEHLAARQRVTALLAGLVTALAAATLGAIALMAQPVSATTVPGPPAGWTTVFSDSFAGSAGSPVNAGNWKYDTGPGSSFGTGEIETMTNSTSNVFLDGSGHLVIKAINSGGAWTSGRIQTNTANVGAPTSPTSSTTSGASMSVAYVAAYEKTSSSSSPSPSPSPSPSSSSPGGGTSCTTTATADISADCDNASKGTISITAATGDTNPAAGVDGNQAAQLSNGDYLEYSNINFGSSGSNQFDARVASGAAGGVSGLVEVVLDNPSNAPVGSFSVANTGGWSTWRTVPANISTVTGTHNVYLEFVSGAVGNPAFVSLHYFAFP